METRDSSARWSTSRRITGPIIITYTRTTRRSASPIHSRSRIAGPECRRAGRPERTTGRHGPERGPEHCRETGQSTFTMGLPAWRTTYAFEKGKVHNILSQTSFGIIATSERIEVAYAVLSAAGSHRLTVVAAEGPTARARMRR